MRSDWVSIGPGKQGLEALRKELEALARHPGDIRTAGRADEFIVPPYLAELYTAPAPAAPTATPPLPKRRRTKKEGDE